jgi:hypothetical protein
LFEDDQVWPDGLLLLALRSTIKEDAYWHLIFEEEYRQVLDGLQEQLGQDTYKAIWEAGQVKTPEAGMAFANSLLVKYAASIR